LISKLAINNPYIKEKGLTFTDIVNWLGFDEVWDVSLFYGQATASEEEAIKLLTKSGLHLELKKLLTPPPPLKGSLDPVIPTDPLIYRCYDIMQASGMSMKYVIKENLRMG